MLAPSRNVVDVGNFVPALSLPAKSIKCNLTPFKYDIVNTEWLRLDCGFEFVAATLLLLLP